MKYSTLSDLNIYYHRIYYDVRILPCVQCNVIMTSEFVYMNVKFNALLFKQLRMTYLPKTKSNKDLSRTQRATLSGNFIDLFTRIVSMSV